MDTTTLLYIGLAVIVVGVLVYQVVTSNSRRNKRFFKLDHQLMGENLPKREYDYGELEHIAKYFQATKQEEFTIDDITWNDLRYGLGVLYDESVPQQQRRRLSLQAAAYTADKQEGA